MSLFQPGDQLEIDGKQLVVAANPQDPTQANTRQGQQSLVYQLTRDDGQAFALKVFEETYRNSLNLDMADELASYAHLPGIAAAERRVLNFGQDGDLLKLHPDLSFAVLLPWLGEETWAEWMRSGSVLAPDEALKQARFLVNMLLQMSEEGLAHCDLRGANLLMQPEQSIALVDLEEVFKQGYMQPDPLPVPAGYTHSSALQGHWGEMADRFAGAILIAEMLGWADKRISASAHGETYFDPAELQDEGSQRYRLLEDVIRDRWGEVLAVLLQNTWNSKHLEDCPTFVEWAMALTDAAWAESEEEPLPDQEDAVEAVEFPDWSSDEQDELSEESSVEEIDFPDWSDISTEEEIQAQETAEAETGKVQPLDLTQAAEDAQPPAPEMPESTVEPDEKVESALLDEAKADAPGMESGEQDTVEDEQPDQADEADDTEIPEEGAEEQPPAPEVVDVVPLEEAEVLPPISPEPYGEQSKKKRSSRMVLIISIVATLLCLGAVSAGVWFGFQYFGAAAAAPAPAQATEAHSEMPAQPEAPDYYIILFDELAKLEQETILPEELAGIEEISQPGTVQRAIEVPAGYPVGIRMGWCAADETTLQDNFTQIAFELTVDGSPVDVAQLAAFGVQEEEMVCVYYTGAVMNWPAGSHTMIKNYHLSTEIQNGNSIYAAGDYRSEYTIIVK